MKLFSLISHESFSNFRFFSLPLDKHELESAQLFLEQAASNNHPDFLKALSDVLSHPGNSPVSRMAAGLQLKNQLTSKDEAVKLKFQANWLQLPEEIRNYIKKNVSRLTCTCHLVTCLLKFITFLDPRRPWNRKHSPFICCSMRCIRCCDRTSHESVAKSDANLSEQCHQ